MKTYLKYSAWVLVFAIVPLLANAQRGLLLKADELYDAKAYQQAIPKYEQAVRCHHENTNALIRLADCYRLTGNFKKALSTYEKVVASADVKPIHKLYYAQALMEAGQYDKARPYLEAYKEDERGANFIGSIDQAKAFSRFSSNYHVSKVRFNSIQNDFSPSLWQEKYLVFTSARPRAQLIGYQHAWTENHYTSLYYVKKKDNNKFSCVHKFSRKIMTRYNNGPVSFSPDGKTVYFTCNNNLFGKDLRAADGLVKLKILQGTLIEKKNKFGNAAELNFNSNDYSCTHPALSPDGSRLYFSSDMPGGFGGMDLWVCQKQENGWGTPKNLGPHVNSSGNEIFPFVAAGNTLYFSSDGLGGMGGLDIFYVALDDKGSPAGVVFNIGAPLNSTKDDLGIWLSPDGASGFFSSNNGTKNNNDDIYSFTVTPFKREISIHGLVTDKQSGEPVPNATVLLKNSAGKTIAETTAGDNGKYAFDAEYDRDYSLIAQKDGYKEPSPSTVSTAVQESDVTVNLVIEKKPKLQIIVNITDMKDNTPLKGVRVELLDKKTARIETGVTSPLGEYVAVFPDKNMGDSVMYNLYLSKDGYAPKSVPGACLWEDPAGVRINESLGEMKAGVDLGKLVGFDPIYFDFGKWNIRPDATRELDKIVAAMIEYPNLTIELGSHTDCRGTAEANMSLSQKRARSSADYIISKGIGKDRITTKGYGETKLINKCECEGDRVVPCTEEEHQMNRRTEFMIIKM